MHACLSAGRDEAAGAWKRAASARNTTSPPDPDLKRPRPAARGIRHGAHPYHYLPIVTPEYDRLVLAQCGTLAPLLNRSLISLTAEEFRIGADGGVVALARAHALPRTGTHLLWFEALPGWFRSIWGPHVGRAPVTSHIRRMGSPHANATWSVDVINGAPNPRNGRQDGSRPGRFPSMPSCARSRPPPPFPRHSAPHRGE